MLMAAAVEGVELAFACGEKARADLEWDRLLGALSDLCPGPLGRRAVLSLPFLPSRQQVDQALCEVREAHETLRDGEPIPSGSAPIISECVDRLRAGGVLGPSELRDIAYALRCARVLRRFLHNRKLKLPALVEICSTEASLDNLERDLSDAFDEDGSLSDRASPKLKELRAARISTRERLIHRLEDVMQKYAQTLQDSFYTEREGRFVLPVKADSHERFAGIVHGTSGSGQTLFMEPRVVIPIGNRLKMIDAEIEREQQEILAQLSSQVMNAIDSVAQAEVALARAELRAASARLTERLQLTFPSIIDTPSAKLIAARHPLLQLDGVKVVPSDIDVASGSALVISGPNAGGKTVVLKTLGLCVLMIRAGLPIPCKADSQIGIFDTVASDVGDEQSLSKNLSTFSAHVKNLTSIINGTFKGALVLLDEIATGTDPREGEALAAAVLDSLCARGGAVACTTHYEGLKALALGDSRFQNASVGFDMATMSPTFELRVGIPGASSALAIARRFGMPSIVIDRAERFLGTEDRGFEDLVRKLNDERRAMELARQSLESELLETQRTRKELAAELAQARERERRLISKETEALLTSVRKAREDLRFAEQKLRSRTRVIERVASKVAIGGELEPPSARTVVPKGGPVDPRAIQRGLRVYVPRIRGEAEVLERVDATHVRVLAGAVKLSVSLDELCSIAPLEPSATTVRVEKGAKTIFDAASDPNVPIMTSENRCDLRGLRVDEGLAMAEQFLDRSLNAERRVAFIIHGHGTGALKDAIRNQLRDSKYVLKFRAGESLEGGDGVTVVWLR
jgi:DNA mismatch repair protein MutS2